MLTTAAIWGFAFVAQRVSFASFGPFTFNGLRFLLGALSLVGLTLIFKPTGLSNEQARWKAAFLPGAIAGAVLFSAANFQQVGLSSTTAGKAAFLTGFYILLVPLAGLVLTRLGHPGTPGHFGVWLGAVLGLAGLFFLSVGEDFSVGLGDGLELVGAVFWSVHILVIDRYSGQVDPLKLSVIQFVVCGVLSLMVGLPTESFTLAGLQTGWILLAYAGIGSVGIAYTLQVVGQRGVAPGPAALIMSLETVFAAFGGWLILGETLGPRELLGCALMLAGMVVAQAVKKS